MNELTIWFDDVLRYGHAAERAEVMIGGASFDASHLPPNIIEHRSEIAKAWDKYDVPAFKENLTTGVMLPVGARGRWKVDCQKRRLGLNMETPETIWEITAEAVAIKLAGMRRRLFGKPINYEIVIE